MNNVSQKIIIGNWKMSLDYKKSLILAKKIISNSSKISKKNEVLLLPDFLSIGDVSKVLNKKILLGSQDVSPFSLGAYTGEVSLESLKQISCSYILVGHSERRQFFNDDLMIADKINNIFKNSSITPILCIGETLEQKKNGLTLSVIEDQLKKAFSKSKNISSKKIIIAYEPIWAIGSGRIVLIDDLQAVIKQIEKVLSKIFKNKKNLEYKIVYGGSVNLKNFQQFKNVPGVSGLLIGGASLNASDFIKIVNNF